MLNRYWNSPALALTIRPSNFRYYLSACLCLAVTGAAGLVFAAGWWVLALAMLLLSVSPLRFLAKDVMCGTTVGWRQGQWLLFCAGQLTPVELRYGFVCLNGLILVRFTEPYEGRHFSILLLADSADPKSLRDLRRRLVLER